MKMTIMTKKYKYTIEMSARYRKELRKMLRRGKSEDDILEVIDMLASDIPLPEHNKDHPLFGRWEGMRECHLRHDFLLTYRYEGTDQLIFEGLGSHSELLGL